MRRHPLALSAILVLLAAGACSDGGPVTLQGAGSAMNRQLAEVVVESDDLVGEMLDLEMGRAAASRDPITVDISFSGMRACPLGGSVSIEGNMHRTFDPSTLTGEAMFSGGKTLSDCAFARGDHVITVNGSAEWEAFRRRVEFRPDGLQTTRYSGSITAVRDDGEERSCAFSFEAVRDPENHTLTVSVTICGDGFGWTVRWEPGDGEG